ncbi:uncharacterized protein [Antedon mediterranea]|uniref:uncharacterized protein n=1 Tax=Antedon mediterranea TaxID=105859 RepID=UPI003AF68119
MGSNFLKLNDKKTEVILFGSVQQRKKIRFDDLHIGGVLVNPSTEVRNLGVQLDCKMTMESHINKICRSAIFHLCNIAKIRRYLNHCATEQIVHAFVTSRLDMGNSLLYGLPKKQLRTLQKVQNWAARLVMCAKKYDHVTPLFKELNWLPMESRVKFKILLLVFRCLNSCAPKYLSELLTVKRELRSSHQSLSFLGTSLKNLKNHVPS